LEIGTASSSLLQAAIGFSGLSLDFLKAPSLGGQGRRFGSGERSFESQAISIGGEPDAPMAQAGWSVGLTKPKLLEPRIL